ncbi:protein-glutamate methylesterase/protein-glutamine glutaminase [Cohnella algarum]|uniref:protein-glutamate methylesterase/protein-glutamine glutaminase n=1 Tax=Cohnella algarum TaxID=2044859 RepID=UPI001966D49B|nr:chemotaxis response regulator protein-glutamate methylesterase [Cohnella algarum]MBN2983617.1 response regulator [Cohnella algarum]
MSLYKVLVVDDSPFMRKVFSDFIAADPAFEVVGIARDGVEAVERTTQLQPDIITMDLEMPHMNGLQALRKIMSVRPTPVIMLSAVTDNGTRDTIKALQYGALDFIRKPDGAVKLDIRKVGEQLLEKLHMAAEMAGSVNFRALKDMEEREPEETEISAPSARDLPPPEGRKPETAAPAAPGKPAPEVGAKPPLSRKAPVSRPLPERPASPKTTNRLDSRLMSKTPRDGLGEQGRAKKPGEAMASAKTPPTPPAAPGKTEARPESPLRKIGGASPSPVPPAESREREGPKGRTDFTEIVVIGTSTGGPRALHEVLSGIPQSFPAPILVVQHMPPKFTHSLAQRLDSFAAIDVREAKDGEPLLTGTAYIAPGGRHMAVKREGAGRYRIELSDGPPQSGHRPSVDWLFESVVGMKELKRHAVLMTGMGSDGAKGMKALRDDGAATTIAEAEQTCVVYGMPRSAVELGATTHVLDLQQIAPILAKVVSGSGKR